ncbi:MAG: RNA methyltransferase [Anaerococcus sp.]|nr:RNA methyltransferase [Anaerococcus sp.]
MIINSQQNSKFKLINKLKQKKYRDKTNSFVIESRKLVDEAISSSANIDFIFLKDGLTIKEGFDKIYLEEGLFDKASSLQSPDGYGAVVKKREPSKITSKRVLLLDKINDPGNMGTMIRSAEAFGFKDIILSPFSVDIYNPKTLRASMGSIFRINIVEKTYEEISRLKKDYKILSSDMAGKDLKKYNIGDEKIILAIGNESNGLSKDLRDITDDFIKISMQGKIESLNAAIAASIMMNTLSL